MRYGKIMVCLITTAFLAVAVFFWSREPEQEGTFPISVCVSSGEGTQNISCWERETGEYCFFLPSYARLSQTRLNIEGSGALRMNGQTLTDGMACEGFQWNVSYDLTLTRKGETAHYQVIFVQSANVPALYVDVRSGSMDYINREKGNKESGSLRLYTADGQLDYAGNVESLAGHGNSSWEDEKKPYNLKLSQRGDLLGMGEAQNWVLLANAFDPSHLRNKIVYEFSDRLGLAYSPECRWVDLYLNGAYAGLYLLSERNEVDPQRVALGSEGSFLVSKEWEWRMEEQGQTFLTTQANAALRIRDASLDNGSILRIWQSAENAILAEDGVDSDTGKHWRELIDVDSWARKYLIEEVFGNVDGGALSQFFYYDGSEENGKIYAGPVWDYDLAMGNAFAYSHPAANQFYANIPDMWGSPWYRALYYSEEFYARITELYETEFLPLLTELLETGIDVYAAEISQAAGMDRLRWNTEEAGAETEAIRTYLTERMEFLNRVWVRGEEHVTVLVQNLEGILSRYEVRPGEPLPQLPESENGWYDLSTGEDFDPAQPIWQDTMIAMKAASVPEEEEAEEAAEEMVHGEPESKLLFVPFLVFLIILAAVCVVDIRQRKGQEKKRTNIGARL